MVHLDRVDLCSLLVTDASNAIVAGSSPLQ
jgi:hypothetical protein